MTHRYSNSLYALLTPLLAQRLSLPPLSVLNDAEPPPSYEPHSPTKHKRAVSSPSAAVVTSVPPITTQHHRALTTLPEQPAMVSQPAATHHAVALQSSQAQSSTSLTAPTTSSGLTPSQLDVNSLSTSFHSLVLQLHNRWLQQHSINTTNNTLHAFNFILHYASISRTVTLHKQQHQLQQQLHQHTQLLATMEDRVAEAESTVGQLTHHMERMAENGLAQQQNLSLLQHEVAEQRERVAQAMAEYETKLAEQAESMQRQERSLERLLLVRLRLDFGVDAVIVALAFYLARLPLLRLLLFTVARQALPVRAPGVRGAAGVLSVRGRRELAVGVGQLVIFGAVVARARSWAVEKGLHNTVGTYSQYAAMAVQTMQAAAYRISEQKHDPQGQNSDLSSSVQPDSQLVPPQPASAGGAPVSPARPLSSRPFSESADSRAAVALHLAGDAVSGVVSSVGSTMLGAGHLVGRLLSFGTEAPDDLRQPQIERNR